MTLQPPRTTLFPYTTLFRSDETTGTKKLYELLPFVTPVVPRESIERSEPIRERGRADHRVAPRADPSPPLTQSLHVIFDVDRKSTRLNSSHSQISYAVFCLK